MARFDLSDVCVLRGSQFGMSRRTRPMLRHTSRKMYESVVDFPATAWGSQFRAKMPSANDDSWLMLGFFC